VTVDPYGRTQLRRDRRRRPRRLAGALRWGIRLLLAAAFFGGGVALGEALHDNPKPGPTQTLVRTLRPLPLAPAPRTVTVTVARR
jgi:hypothetical protein